MGEIRPRLAFDHAGGAVKTVVAPDSFKGSLGSIEAARAIAEGIRRVLPLVETVELPVADGGEGTVEALVAARGGRISRAYVTGPLGDKVEAAYGLLDDGTGVVEAAAASGLGLVPSGSRDPSRTTSRGTGELVSLLLDSGCRRIIVGLGGTATNDGGLGLAQALGISFQDSGGRELEGGGASLASLATIDLSARHPRLAGCELLIASDVDNPLVGPQGASAVFGPQKGAGPSMVASLDSSLAHLADVIEAETGERFHERPGAGAAGGMAAVLMAFCGASPKGCALGHSGIDLVLDAVGFEAAALDSDLVVTGEGRIDGQSARGKAPIGVARRARLLARSRGRALPVVALVGAIGPGADTVYAEGIDSILCIADGPMGLEDGMATCGLLLSSASERMMRLILACQYGHRGSLGDITGPSASFGR
jgi:glycerate kinase